MFQLLETIRIVNNSPWNLEYHNSRFNNSRMDLYGINDSIDIGEYISCGGLDSRIIYKCRIIYDEKIRTVEFIPYLPKEVNALKIVHSNTIDYSYKYADRNSLEEMLGMKGECDEILIVKKNLLTDVSYGNIALFNGKEWHTPATPLLKGTMRQRLVDNEILLERDIDYRDLKDYSKISIINSMLDLDTCIIKVENVIIN